MIVGKLWVVKINAVIESDDNPLCDITIGRWTKETGEFEGYESLQVDANDFHILQEIQEICEVKEDGMGD